MLANRLIYGNDGWVRAESSAPTKEVRIAPIVNFRH
jgi:hypothetical protein